MGINYEYERHIRAAEASGNKVGAEFLRAQRHAFNMASRAKMVEELPLEEHPDRRLMADSQIYRDIYDPDRSSYQAALEPLNLSGRSFNLLMRMKNSQATGLYCQDINGRLIDRTARELCLADFLEIPEYELQAIRLVGPKTAQEIYEKLEPLRRISHSLTENLADESEQ